MSIEAMKQARSVISSINAGKQHAIAMNGETVFWQREEWVRWALDEVLPLIDKSIAEAEKQSQCTRVACMGSQGCIDLCWQRKPKREPLTFEQVEDCFPDGTIFAEQDGWLRVSAQTLHDIARNVEAAHGIKEKA